MVQAVARTSKGFCHTLGKVPWLELSPPVTAESERLPGRTVDSGAITKTALGLRPEELLLYFCPQRVASNFSLTPEAYAPDSEQSGRSPWGKAHQQTELTSSLEDGQIPKV